MKCPICQKPVDPKKPEAPFCSDRCRLIDLGNWASGKYVIPTPINPKSEDEADEDEP
jgi:endogenous inhibitor of DNA gyrase (YacG/DUF329 family)